MNEKERIAWLINYLKKEHGLKDHQLAEQWGIDKNTVAAYRKARGITKGNVLASLAKDFNINGEWIITGKGEPFPGAREKFPEICGQPGFPQEVYDKINSSVKTQMSAASIREADASYQSLSDKQKYDIEGALGKAYRVLAVGNALSDALFRDIQQFAAAMDAERELKECKDRLAAQQREIDELKRKMELIEAVPTGQKEAV